MLACAGSLRTEQGVCTAGLLLAGSEPRFPSPEAVTVADRGHSGHAYRQLWRAIIEAPDFLVCQLCYQPIDRRIRGRQRWAPSLDMILPYACGGDPEDPYNYRPAHYGCNSRRGKGERPDRRWIMGNSP